MTKRLNLKQLNKAYSKVKDLKSDTFIVNEKFLKNFDWDGLAKAYNQEQDSWHAEQWKEFVKQVESQLLDRLEEKIKEANIMVIVDKPALGTATGTSYIALWEFVDLIKKEREK